jgi:ATP/maltotriose-dependent transcriptional regulator MalT
LRQDKAEHWLTVLEQELDNMRAAFNWFVEQGCREQALRLFHGLLPLWARGGRDVEADRWFRDGFAANGSLSDVIRNRAFLMHGSNLVLTGRALEARPILEDALRTVESLESAPDQLRQKGLALRMQALAAQSLGEITRARRLFEQALALNVEEPLLANMLTYGLGSVLLDAGELVRSRALVEDGLARARENGEFLSTVWCLILRADLDRLESSLDAAERGYRESLRLAESIGWRRATWPCLGGLAGVAAARGDLDRAGRLWGAMMQSLDENGTTLFGPNRRRYEPIFADRAEPEYLRALEQGHRLSLEQAIAEALC